MIYNKSKRVGGTVCNCILKYLHILLDLVYRIVDKCTEMNNTKFIEYNYKFFPCRRPRGSVVKYRVNAHCGRTFPKTFLFVKIIPWGQNWNKTQCLHDWVTDVFLIYFVSKQRPFFGAQASSLCDTKWNKKQTGKPGK